MEEEGAEVVAAYGEVEEVPESGWGVSTMCVDSEVVRWGDVRFHA